MIPENGGGQTRTANRQDRGLVLSPIELRHHGVTSRTRTGIAGATVPRANRCTIVTMTTKDTGQIRTVVNRVCKPMPYQTRPRCPVPGQETAIFCQRKTEEARFELAVDLLPTAD